MDLFSVLRLLCGLAFFLFGMQVMSHNLERLAGGKLEGTLKKMTSNAPVSMVLGAIITIAMQSSSACTVMLVGLVNSGIMQFSQTLNVIFGANIGTTLTAWILSLSGIQSDNLVVQMLKPANFSPLLALIGVFMTMVCKKDRSKSIGNILVGFAVLMIGMSFMSDAVSPLADLPEFGQLMIQFRNPIVGVLVGTLFTALIQSSAASVGILQALSITGSITCGMALPIIMGQNIGTCVTAIISCIGTSTNAKRVAVIHTLIKILGTVILLPLFLILNSIFHFPITNQPVDAWGVAMLHTLFNILTTVILIPNSKLLIRFTNWLTKEKAPKQELAKREICVLDDLLLRSPSVAVQECANYTTKMCLTARDTLKKAMSLLIHYDEKVAAEVIQLEDDTDQYEDRLGTFLVRLSAQALSHSDSQSVSVMLHTIGDFERLGDHAVNVQQVAQEMYEKKLSFTAVAQKEVDVLTAAIEHILKLTEETFVSADPVLASKVEPLEQVIDELIAQIKDHHVDRLRRGECTIEMGFILSDLLNNYGRISDHCSNIAVAIIEVAHNSFDTHKYLNGIKYGSEAFDAAFEEFEKQYALDNG